MTINCKTCGGPVELPERQPFTTMIETQCPHCHELLYVIPLQQGKATPTGERVFPWLPPFP